MAIIQGTVLVDIGNEDPEWGAVEEEMQSTIRFNIHTAFIISWGGVFIIGKVC